MRLEKKLLHACFRKNCWLKRTACEQILIILFGLLLMTGIALLVFVLLFIEKNEINTNICLSPDCVKAASAILRSIDKATDPCKDFSKFSCEKGLQNSAMNEDETFINHFATTSDFIFKKLKLILEEPLAENSTKSSRLIKQFYELCMDTNTIELDGLFTIKSIIKELGGWPLLDNNNNNWNEKWFDWKKIMYIMKRLGFNQKYLIAIYVCPNINNSSRLAICIDEGELSLSGELLVKGIHNKNVLAYYDYIVDIAEYFGANKSFAFKEIRDILAFEMKLAYIQSDRSRNSTVFYNQVTIKELHKQFSYFNWIEYIAGILNIPDKDLIEQDIVIIASSKYLNQLNLILQQTSKRVLANNIIMNLITSNVFYLDKNLQNKERKYRQKIVSLAEPIPRWKECTKLVTKSLYLASAAAYSKRFFNIETKRYTEEIVTNVQTQFINILKTIDWVDAKSKLKIVEKAQSIIKQIAFPDEFFDEEYLEKFYSDLQIDTKNFLKTANIINIFNEKYYNGKLLEEFIKKDWISDPDVLTVNSFYDSNQNSLSLPVGVLQSIYLNTNRPRYLNYGSVGYIAGYELTQGIGDIVKQYVIDGALDKLWNKNTESYLNSNTRCIFKQYGNYNTPEYKVKDNKNTRTNENFVASIGGIRESYLAYQKWIESNGPEKYLLGLNYTQNQLFWISMVNTMCSKIPRKQLKNFIETEYYQNSKLKINSLLSNSKYFAEDFKCSLGSPMNPFEKCLVL